MNQFGGDGFVNFYLEIYVCKIKISSKNSQKPERKELFLRIDDAQVFE